MTSTALAACVMNGTIVPFVCPEWRTQRSASGQAGPSHHRSFHMGTQQAHCVHTQVLCIDETDGRVRLGRYAEFSNCAQSVSDYNIEAAADVLQGSRMESGVPSPDHDAWRRLRTDRAELFPLDSASGHTRWPFIHRSECACSRARGLSLRSMH